MQMNGQLLTRHIKNIHLIGIGGISMSGLAYILKDLGYHVSGSDAVITDTILKLEEAGIHVYKGHFKENISTSIDLIVYTAAIKQDNPEMIAGQSMNIRKVERAVLLGEMMKKYTTNISVAGTHGKTTTSSMLSTIMLHAEKDPTIHVGGVFDQIGGSTRIGSTDFLITEACEYVESFLHFHSNIAIVLNIEEDHLDYFDNIDAIKKSYLKFIHNIPKDGFLIANIDDSNISSMLDHVQCKVLTYGIDSNFADYMAKNIEFNHLGHASYDLFIRDEYHDKISLSVAGQHNVSNSLACIAASFLTKCDPLLIKEGLRGFHGTHRRFQPKGEIHGVLIVDDYAHHPTEINASISTAKMLGKKRIWCVFQPHTYTRTKALFKDFVRELLSIDHIIVADIYAAREKDLGEVHSSQLADALKSQGKDAIYLSSFHKIYQYLREHVSDGDLIMTMGAGDVFKVADMLLDNQDR
jgi:UDP-N-acetylmuramate--alanine ligase